MNAIAPTFGCTIGGMPFAEALACVLDLADEPLGAEDVLLEDCVGQTAAAPFTARLSLPGFDQSAMDGYAVHSAGLTPGAWLPVAGRTAAGQPPGSLAPGAAHHILTGAPLPEGADAVIAQEQVVREGDVVRLAAVPPPGTNVRRRGEDIQAGQELIPAGAVLDWRHVTVLASQGVMRVPARRRPRGALLSSGRELRGPGEILAPGQIHDSNHPMLAALLRAWGADVRPHPPRPRCRRRHAGGAPRGSRECRPGADHGGHLGGRRGPCA